MPAPVVAARVPQLYAAFQTLSNLASGAVQCGPDATAAVVSSGVFGTLVQVQLQPTPGVSAPRMSLCRPESCSAVYVAKPITINAARWVEENCCDRRIKCWLTLACACRCRRRGLPRLCARGALAAERT